MDLVTFNLYTKCTINLRKGEFTCKAQFRCLTFHEPNLIQIKAGANHENLMKISTSESKTFQSRNSRLSQVGRTAEPFQIEAAVHN